MFWYEHAFYGENDMTKKWKKQTKPKIDGKSEYCKTSRRHCSHKSEVYMAGLIEKLGVQSNWKSTILEDDHKIKHNLKNEDDFI